MVELGVSVGDEKGDFGSEALFQRKYPSRCWKVNCLICVSACFESEYFAYAIVVQTKLHVHACYCTQNVYTHKVMCCVYCRWSEVVANNALCCTLLTDIYLSHSRHPSRAVAECFC